VIHVIFPFRFVLTDSSPSFLSLFLCFMSFVGKSNVSYPLWGFSLLYMIHIFQGITEVFAIFYMSLCADSMPLYHLNDLDSATHEPKVLILNIGCLARILVRPTSFSSLDVGCS
jgi:hypothetical protein